MCGTNNEIKFDYSEYNKILWNKIKEIKETLTDKEAIIYKYNWKTSKAEKSEEEPHFNKATIDYYWVEFEDNGQKLKISAFYKDFDTKTGNIHVIQGKLQLWKKCDGETSHNILKLHCQGCVPLREKMLNGFWCGFNEMDTSKFLMKYSINDFDYNKANVKYDNLNVSMSSFLVESMRKVTQKQCFKHIGNTEFDFNWRISNGVKKSRHYPLLKWWLYGTIDEGAKKVDTRKRHLLVMDHKIFFDNNDNLYFKYGEIQILLIEAGADSPNIYNKEDGWKLFYPFINDKKEEKYPKIDSQKRAFTSQEIKEVIEEMML